jgi:hypothetical protein
MKLRYSKPERLRKHTAEQVLKDPAATSADRMAAVRCLERLESAARRRAEEREWNLPEPAPPAEPTVDQLVSDLEKAEKCSSQLIENKGPENDQNAINGSGASTNAGKALEVTQTATEPKNAFCGFCQSAGQWNTRYPIDEPNGVLLCPACFGKMISADALKTTAKAAARQSWLYEKGEDPNTFDLSAVHGTAGSDFQKSVLIWEQQAAQDAAERERLISEVERKQARDRADLAEFISRGGRL